MTARHMCGWVALLAATSALTVAGCAHKKPPVESNPTETTTPPPTPTPAPQDTTIDRAGQTGVEEVSALSDVQFDYDSSDLGSDAKATLSANGSYLLKHTDVSISIEGHCDERGTVQYNLALGERRATTAKDFLISYGVDAGRISTISYGKERPIDPGHDEYAWAKNRRAHFVKLTR